MEETCIETAFGRWLVVHYNGFPYWLFSRSNILECVERISKNVIYASALIDLKKASQMLFVLKLNAASILLQVAAGNLRAYRDKDIGLRLGSLSFTKSDIQAYLQKVRAEKCWISREDVTQLLTVKGVTLVHWVKTGLIIPTIIHSHIQYFEQKSIEDFTYNYVDSDQTAIVLAVTRLTVQKWARAGRLTGACVSGPTINGHHAYLFDKEKLISWREERLSFGEAVKLLGVSKATLNRWVTEGKVQPLSDMGGKQRWFSHHDINSILGGIS